MMFSLKESFYTIKEKNRVSESQVEAVIDLNVNHDIYKGHFPEQPIVPGVCQIQIIKEFLEDLMGKTLQMTSGDNIKFTGMIIPTQNPQVNFSVNYKVNGDEILCEAKLFFGETVFTKYKGKFKIV